MITKSLRHQVINIVKPKKLKSFPQKTAVTVTNLSVHDWDRVNQLMTNPPKPNDRLKNLLSKESKIDSGYD